MKTPTVSILITAYHEADTIGRALKAITGQIDDAEIVVITPDDQTASAASAFPGVKVLRDPAQGKPVALNQGLLSAHGDIIVMTDGDVWVDQGAMDKLLEPFVDPKVGAVSGRPISVSPRTTMLGYWSHLLTDAGAHSERMLRDSKGVYFVCSGYMYAIRARVIPAIPDDALAEDAVVSQLIAEKGYQIRYAPEARVFVQYPTSYADWLMQKVRSTGGYAQPIIAQSAFQMRSFWHEASAGLWRALSYPRNLREFWWTVLLMGARLHLWLLVLWRVRIQKRPLKELWQRVETTKG